MFTQGDLGRYGPGTGAFLLPVYGGGELPQAFCRVAAVTGALYVLRQGIKEFLVDPGSELCSALVTSSGQAGHLCFILICSISYLWYVSAVNVLDLGRS